MSTSIHRVEDIPAQLRVERTGDVAVVTLARPQKRNALSNELILGLEGLFTTWSDDVRAVVLAAEGPHFCAGLDMGEMSDHDAMAGVRHSRMWHRVFDLVAGGDLPVVAALKGAVVGGGLELAAAAHLRVADESTWYALPEGQRGLFVGGGASVRVSRLVGVSRMTDMMLTGRRYDAGEGMVAGLSQYVVPTGTADERALELASRIATNAPQTNFAVLDALPRIADMNPHDGLFLESLMAGIAQSTDDAKDRMRGFLDGRAAKADGEQP